MIVLDTNIVSHLSYGNKNVLNKIDEAGDDSLAITIITRNEILRGRTDNLLKAADKAELRRAAERMQQAEERSPIS